MKTFLQKYGTVAAFVALFFLFAVFSDRFLTPHNIINIFKQISYLTIIALGFTLALITAELDLSFANVGSLCSVVTAALLHSGKPIALACFCGLSVGILFGVINGVLVTRLKIPSLIATLATLPSLDELRGKLIGLIQAPASQLARLLCEPGAQLARLLAARAKQDETAG